MRLAFYKGRHRLFDRAVQWWTRGPYSHVELVFSDGLAASSSVRDGGVRVKAISFAPDRWDILPIDGDEATARAWFDAHRGEAYDAAGLFGFVWRPAAGATRRWFCSEAVAAALGMGDAWRFCPNTLAATFRR